MGGENLLDEVDALIFSWLSQHPLMEGDNPIDLDADEVLGLTRAVNRGLREAILRLAKEVEALKEHVNLVA
jgi:hypothetical protein